MDGILHLIRYPAWALHALVWLPLLGMALVLAAPARRARHIAFALGTIEFAVSAPLWTTFAAGRPGFQLVSTAPWIPQWGISYRVGLDGISLVLVLLTTFITPLALLGSFRYVTRRERAFYAMMLLLETGILGAFLALDLFLFFVFWELLLLPMYFIIGVWGGERRIYAAMKFVLYTSVGSLLMLVAILYLYFRHAQVTGFYSSAYLDLLRLPLSPREQLWLFAAFALAFAIKVPVVPLHTWLPDAHVEAPTPGSVILAAILLKLGAFGFLRFLLPFFPVAATAPGVTATFLVLGLLAVVYAAWVAAVQPDAKSMVAYTSVAHMGFVVLGIFALTPEGMLGALMVMLSHGVATGAMFLLIGMLYERRHTRLLEDFGGLAAVAPWFATAFMVTALTSIGLPGTSGFVGEFLALLGTFETHPWVAGAATTGVIFAAYYMLPMVERIWFGRLERDENRHLPDLGRREVIILAPLLAAMLWLGVYPKPFLARLEPTVAQLLREVTLRSGALAAAGESGPAPSAPRQATPGAATAVAGHLRCSPGDSATAVTTGLGCATGGVTIRRPAVHVAGSAAASSVVAPRAAPAVVAARAATQEEDDRGDADDDQNGGRHTMASSRSVHAARPSFTRTIASCP